MIVNKIETPFRSFLESLKVPSVPNMKGRTLFSPDEINYLARYSFPSIYEFVQENEPDKEFLETFTQWLREDEIIDGYVDTYMIFYLRYAQKLSGDEFEYLERNIPCLGKGHVWLYELNYRRRFRLRVKLIHCLKTDFKPIVRKEIRK